MAAAQRFSITGAANKCRICEKSVYPMDPQLNLDGKLFHKVCCVLCVSQSHYRIPACKLQETRRFGNP